jgi:ferredoxin-NADP reductase
LERAALATQRSSCVTLPHRRARQSQCRSRRVVGWTLTDFRRIWLYYVVHDDADAVYDSEIRESYLEAESYIDYALWSTAQRGRITAAQIASEIAPKDFAVMLCGQVSFISDLARQFRALGVSRDRIITEEFEFR